MNRHTLESYWPSYAMDYTFIWDLSPVLLSKGFLTIRWYNLLFASALWLGFYIVYHMFARDGKPKEAADQLRLPIILGVILGARIGHVVFYQWNDYKDRLLEIFLPVTFSPTFKVTGYAGLASHGAFVGVILAIFFYIRKLKISISPPRIYFNNRWSFVKFLEIADYVAILSALGSGMIRMGNFMNSEIIGKPTGTGYGVIFVRDLHEHLCKEYSSMIQDLVIGKASAAHMRPIKAHYQPIELAITFQENVTDEQLIKDFLEQSLKFHLVQEAHSIEKPHIYETYGTPLTYTLQKQKGGYKASLYTWGIPRHPTQLYESFSYLLIFVVLFVWWRKKGQALAPGRIFGTFMILAFVFRFLHECVKENQVAFEDTMWLNMGQLLSLPGIVAGLFLILRRRTPSPPLQ